MQHPPALAYLEEATTVFSASWTRPTATSTRGAEATSRKKLSDSEVSTLALLQQLRGIESQRASLRDVERFLAHLFPNAVGLAPSSFHRRLRKLGRFLEPLRRAVVPELVGDPETLPTYRGHRV
ncbi:MAG: hypothetical protein M3R38_25140 [Actinomycetota bacterium]|nr:hypothetical protein [Actinomycetota bacterium]